MYVYISGPYSLGDQALNVRAAVEAADALLNAGFFPYVRFKPDFALEEE